jgi:hypothetical protein
VHAQEHSTKPRLLQAPGVSRVSSLHIYVHQQIIGGDRARSVSEGMATFMRLHLRDPVTYVSGTILTHAAQAPGVSRVIPAGHQYPSARYVAIGSPWFSITYRTAF